MRLGKSDPMSSPTWHRPPTKARAAMESAKNECLAPKRVDQSAFFNSLLGRNGWASCLLFLW